MPVGTPFHDRTLPLARSLNYREWAGYYAPSSYATVHEHEYHALRHACGLIDISPLFKYRLSGPDAAAVIDRIITRDVTRLGPGQVLYTPWCDEHGRVIDDGTVSCLDEQRYRWTAAEPNLRWILQQAVGRRVIVEDVSERTAALALQGPTSAGVLRAAASADIDALKYFRVTPGTIAGRAVDISRTGYTGDLGYEIWMSRDDAIAVWDAIAGVGADFGLQPAGLIALDVARIEAGLLLIDTDFVGVRKAITASRVYTPFEMSLDRLVAFDKPSFIGRDALLAEQRRGPRRRVVGLIVEWTDVETLYEAVGLPPLAQATASREVLPVFANGQQVGRVTSSTWSPMLKQMIALATVDAPFAGVGAVVEVEHTVDAVRHRVRARVSQTPFFNPPRKTATPPA